VEIPRNGGEAPADARVRIADRGTGGDADSTDRRRDAWAGEG